MQEILEKYTAKATAWGIEFLPKLAMALAILIIGFG